MSIRCLCSVLAMPDATWTAAVKTDQPITVDTFFHHNPVLLPINVYVNCHVSALVNAKV